MRISLTKNVPLIVAFLVFSSGAPVLAQEFQTVIFNGDIETLQVVLDTARPKNIGLGGYPGQWSFAIDSAAKTSGKYSLQVNLAGPKPPFESTNPDSVFEAKSVWTLSRYKIPIPGEVAVMASVKTTLMPEDWSVQLAIFAQGVNSWLPAWQGGVSSTDWTEVNTVITIPSGSTNVMLIYVATEPGSIWIDNVKVMAPVGTRYAPYMRVVPREGIRYADGAIILDRPAGFHIRIFDARGALCASRNGFDSRFSIRKLGLAAGNYAVSVKAGAGDGVLMPVIIGAD